MRQAFSTHSDRACRRRRRRRRWWRWRRRRWQPPPPRPLSVSTPHLAPLLSTPQASSITRVNPGVRWDGDAAAASASAAHWLGSVTLQPSTTSLVFEQIETFFFVLLHEKNNCQMIYLCVTCHQGPSMSARSPLGSR